MSTFNAQIYEEAGEWIILHRNDELDAAARQRFDAWIRESPHHLKAYLEMSAVWEEVPALNRDWNPSAGELIARARADANVFPFGVERVAEKQLGIGRAVRGRLLALAAVVALGGFATWLFVFQDVYTTATGEQRTLALTDGSTVELNAQTKIRIAYSDSQRTVQLLRGQALFKVAKDPDRPFTVDSAGTRIRAVGTQFDVYQRADGTQVTVVEGRVAVAGEPTQGAGDQSRGVARLLVAGEQILMGPAIAPELPAAEGVQANQTPASGTQSPAPVVKPANIEAATAWTQQRLVFEFTPLTEVAAEFNRYNRRPLIIEDPSLADFNVSGSFSSTDPTLLLRFLREQPGIVVNESAAEIRISRQRGAAG